MTQAVCICFKLFMQVMACALVLACDNAGNSMAARMAMMAMTTSSSIKVKPSRQLLNGPFLLGPKPSLADLAAYHPLWFIPDQLGKTIPPLSNAPKVIAWMARVAQIGHGAPAPMLSTEALRAWPGTVTLLTIADGRDDIGTTVSAFCPVSMDPPVVLASLIADSYPAEVLGRAGLFSVTLLGSGQRMLAKNAVAKSRSENCLTASTSEPGSLIPFVFMPEF